MSAKQSTVTLTLSTADRDRLVALLMADVDPSAPAKAAPKAKKAAAPKGRALTKANRKEFVALNPEFAGWSTNEIALALLDGYEAVGGFVVGPRRTEYLAS